MTILPYALSDLPGCSHCLDVALPDTVYYWPFYR